MPADLSQADMLDTIVRAAMKREYDKGNQISNAAAFAGAVRRRELDNDAAIQGSLGLSYRAAVKLLAEDETVQGNTEAYQDWTPDPPGPVATKDEANRWVAIQFAILSLPRDHVLRQAVRETCNRTRPWDAEHRQATDEEAAQAETDALQVLAYLEAVAADTGVHLEHDDAKRKAIVPTRPRPQHGDLEPILPSQPAPDADQALEETGEDPPPDTLAA